MINRNKLGVQGRRGRPLGFKLSEASKRLISTSKKGKKHTESTKTKISNSLSMYFRNKAPLSNELLYTYGSDDSSVLSVWVRNSLVELDDTYNVLSSKTLDSKTRIEIVYGDDIEQLFGHSLTPEALLLFKEEFELRM